MRSHTALLLLLCIGVSVPALAETEASIGICPGPEVISAPDRPNAAATADPTQCGVVEVEYGWTRQWLGAGTSATSFNSKLRAGLSENLDVRWSADNYSSLSSGGSGWGDIMLGGRYRFLRQNHRRPAMALMYSAKVPTASVRKGLGTGYLDHSAALLLSKDMGRNHFDVNAGYAWLGERDGFTGMMQWAIAYSRPIRERLSGLVEISGIDGEEHRRVATAVLAYRVRPRFAVDCGLDLGLTSGVPRKRLLVGFSYAVGQLYSRKSR